MRILYVLAVALIAGVLFPFAPITTADATDLTPDSAGSAASVAEYLTVHNLTTTELQATPLPTDDTRCHTRTVTLSGGTYVHGLRYHYDGDSYDREGLTLAPGTYTWRDCMLPVNNTYIQLSRLHSATVPDTDPDTSTVVHLREPPETTGPIGWGSFLIRTT